MGFLFLDVMSQSGSLESELREAKSTLQAEKDTHAEYRAEAAKTIRSLCNQLLAVSTQNDEPDEQDDRLMFVPEMRQMVAQHSELMERLEAVTPMKQELEDAQFAIGECEQLQLEFEAARHEEDNLLAQLKKSKASLAQHSASGSNEYEDSLREELQAVGRELTQTQEQLAEAQYFVNIRSKFD